MKKRFISLLLALACVLTPSAHAADPAAYTDAADVTHWEAVAALSQLGVIEGKDGGVFDPAGTVTRAEAAKLLTLTQYGGALPILGVKPTPSFTDIKGHWAETMIEYCASAGIISGRGDGTFDPDAAVTGTEFAKLLLCSLGYDPNIYELNGADWAINTNRYANELKVKLYDGVTGMDPNDPVSRDNAAQMLYNALKATPKVLKPEENTEGVIEWVVVDAANDDGTPQTFLWMKFALDAFPAVPAQPAKQ